jgi:hypothetical protein
MRRAFASFMALLCATSVVAADLPAKVEVTIEPPKFGDIANILKVDSTVASFKLDEPVSHLALVLEAYPKEAQSIPIGRLALALTKPVKEGRFCVQMADQGFIPLGNGAPHQMQLFMQIDCGGTLISSSQSFLKEKFNFSKSLARMGAGTQQRKVTGHRVPMFWLMGNSDTGTYLNDEDLNKMVAKNRMDAYVLIAYLEIAKEGTVPVLAGKPAETAKPTETIKPATASAGAASPALALTFVGPPYPVPSKKPASSTTNSKSKLKSSAPAKSGTKSSSSKKKKGS